AALLRPRLRDAPARRHGEGDPPAGVRRVDGAREPRVPRRVDPALEGPLRAAAPGAAAGGGRADPRADLRASRRLRSYAPGRRRRRLREHWVFRFPEGARAPLRLRGRTRRSIPAEARLSDIIPR